MKKLVMGLVGVMSLTALATTFSYQGVLRDATGGALADKSKTILFCLYNGPATDQVLWSDSKAVMLDENGLFNVELGDDELDAVLSANTSGSLYIGLTVKDSSGEIRPRQKLLPVPLASFAQDVSFAKKDFTVSGVARFNADVQVLHNQEVKGTNTVATLSVSNGATISGDVNMTGALNLSSGRLEMPDSASFTIGGVSAVIPKGVIVMWSGATSNVPAGWSLCDGSNGTPDLRNRFIVGAGGAYSPSQTGGADTVTLTAEQMPAHTHAFAGDDQLATIATKAWSAPGYDADSETGSKWNSAYFNTSSTGGGQAHENRPPYYALCFIIKN